MADLTGTIKFFVPGKEYGFIRPDDGSKDVFFHVSRLDGFKPFDTGLFDVSPGGADLSDPETLDGRSTEAVASPDQLEARAEPGCSVRFALEAPGKIPRAAWVRPSSGQTVNQTVNQTVDQTVDPVVNPTPDS